LRHKAALVTTAALAAIASCCLAEQPSINITSIDGARIRVDGHLDEEAWTNAAMVALVQQSPHPGSATPYSTTMRVITDHNKLYFGFTCADPAPEKIAIHTMQRDGDMYGDDSVAIVLDTFGDQRSGYYFRVNAAGARDDGLISTPDDIPLDWDGVWDARVARTTSGWTAEIELPVSTIRFDPKLQSWRFNAERYIPRERQTLRWSGPTLDARLADFRRAGALEVPAFHLGAGVTFNLNTLARRTSDFTTGDHALAGRTGVDVGYNVTPQLGAVVTVNTDFAETEVDTRQINLTQFPLFFPEKRTFFLEGSNQFNFGLNLGTDFVPFYSRAVGLVEGSIVPIDAGLKVLGRAGKWGIAALDVETGAAHSLTRRNLFASRLTYDATDHLRVGTLLTGGDPEFATHNRFGGVDAVWTTSTLFGFRSFQNASNAFLMSGESSRVSTDFR